MRKNAFLRPIGGLILGAALTLFAGVLPAQQQSAQPVQPVQPNAKAPATPKTGSAAKKPASTSAGTFDHSLLHPDLLRAKAPDQYQVKFATTQGDFVVAVTRAWAPLGADRFYNLVKHHFYDKATFFRVIQGFMVQFGLSAYPPVSTAWEHADIKDDAVTQSNKRGYITFATAGPNTRTTQVFINLVDNPRLDGMGFAAFGQVTDGMGIVDKLYTGYGEGAPGGAGPAQDEIQKQGKAYLDKGWPKLDSIKTAIIIAPAAKKSPTN